MVFTKPYISQRVKEYINIPSIINHHQITIIITDINYIYLIKSIYGFDKRKLNPVNYFILLFYCLIFLGNFILYYSTIR